MLTKGLVAGGLVIGALVLWAINSNRNGGAFPPPPGGAAVVPGQEGSSTPATVTLTPEQNAANQAAYDARLERDRGQAAEREKSNLQSRYGNEKVVTVIINGVPGDPVAADNYLHRKLFRASYHDYSESSKRAQAATEQNRKQAEQQAVSQQQNQLGFGPMFVHYRYQRVESDMPYPTIVKGTKANGTFVYHAAPVLALDQFAVRFDIGRNVKIDPGSRTVTIQAELPSPVPDPDVEEMYLQYGREGVATVRVKEAKGETDRVTYYLETQTGKLDPKINLAVAGVKSRGSGEYELSVAPVSDLRVFAERITYGELDTVDPDTRTITVLGKLPSELPKRPTADELAELRKKEWDAHWKKPSTSDEQPRDGEDFYVWALRVIKGNQPRASKAALLALKLRDVEEDHVKEVAETLSATLKDSWNVSEHLETMAVWKTADTEKTIIGLVGDIHFHRHSKAIMNALASFKTKESARALAMGLSDRSYGDDATFALIEMGSVAEDAVLRFADNQDDGVRNRVYDVLAEIGTEKCLTKLRSNMGKERDKAMKDRVKDVIDQIKERVDSGNPDNPFATKKEGSSGSKDKKDENPFTPKGR